MNTGRLNPQNLDIARCLINDVYDNTEGFEFWQAEEIIASKEPTAFAGWVGSELVSFAYGNMINHCQGIIHWACSKRNFRDKCFSFEPIKACVLDLQKKGANKIHVSKWLDGPYRQLIESLNLSGIRIEHGQLTLRLNMQNYNNNPPTTKSGYQLRRFREGDEKIWAQVKNEIFASSSTASDFWTQNYLGVNMRSDFDPLGFFFAEHNGYPVGICAGLVLHDRKKIDGSYPGGIGWTGVSERCRSVGLGRSLMLSALNYLNDNGIIVTEVGTQFYRTAALNLYESLGFRIHLSSFNLYLQNETIYSQE